VVCNFCLALTIPLNLLKPNQSEDFPVNQGKPADVAAKKPKYLDPPLGKMGNIQPCKAARLIFLANI